MLSEWKAPRKKWKWEPKVPMDCRSTNDARTAGKANSLQAPAEREWLHLTVSCSQSWTWMIFRINGEPAGRELSAIHIDVTDKTWLDVDEREFKIHQFRRRLQHPQQSLRVPLCNATGSSVECIDQRQVEYRLENDCDVGLRKCDKPDRLRWDTRRREHRDEA